MPPPGRDPNVTYFDSDRRPLPGTEFQNNSGRYPIGGPYNPGGQQFPDWVDPNSGYVIEYDRDGNPYYAWYPNGQYQGGNPFIDGDALMKHLMYPRYTADRLPDPNWRPSRPGETPPWINNPAPYVPPPPTKEYLERTAREDAARDTAANQQYESDRMQRQQAQEAGAIFVRDNKKQRWGVYYPPGYQGPKVNIDKSRTPDRGAIVEIGDPRQLGEEGRDWQVYDLKGGYKHWDNQPTMSFADAQQRRQAAPAPGAPAPGAPAPGAPAPGAPAAAPEPAPQMSWQDTEAQRRSEWEAGGQKSTGYFDRYGNYNPDGYGTGPQMTQAESAYWAEQRKVNPGVYQAQMYDPGDWAGQDAQRRMKTVKGPGGMARMTWDTTDPQYAALSAEQKSAGDAKMAAFNQQFDPNNAVNPNNEKLYKVQQMSPQLRQTLMANQAQSTPAQKAAWAQWGDALTRFNSMQGGQVAPEPGPAPGPRQMPQPQAQQPRPQAPQGLAGGNMGDARFANGNPYYNRKGNLRMPFQNAIAREMVSGMGGNDSGTSWNMGGPNSQALFGTQNNYGYWPQGQQQNGMARQAYGASPQAAMNFYGGYGY